MTNMPETMFEAIFLLAALFIIGLIIFIFYLIIFIGLAGSLYILVKEICEWVQKKENEKNQKKTAVCDGNLTSEPQKQPTVNPIYPLSIVIGIFLFICVSFLLYRNYWSMLSDNVKIVILFLPLIVSACVFLYIRLKRPYLLDFRENTVFGREIIILIIIMYFVTLIAFPIHITYENFYKDFGPLTEEETYKMKVNVIGPYQFADDDRYIMITEIPFPALVSPAKNVRLFKDENDFVIDVLNNTSDTHATGYVKQLLIAGYTMTDQTGSIEEQQKAIAEGNVIYYVIRVKNGNYVMEGLYVDGVPIEEYGK